MSSPKRGRDSDRTLASSRGPLRAHGKGNLRVLPCPAPQSDSELSASVRWQLPAQLGTCQRSWALFDLRQFQFRVGCTRWQCPQAGTGMAAAARACSAACLRRCRRPWTFLWPAPLPAAPGRQRCARPAPRPGRRSSTICALTCWPRAWARSSSSCARALCAQWSRPAPRRRGRLQRPHAPCCSSASCLCWRAACDRTVSIFFFNAVGVYCAPALQLRGPVME